MTIIYYILYILYISYIIYYINHYNYDYDDDDIEDVKSDHNTSSIIFPNGGGQDEGEGGENTCEGKIKCCQGNISTKKSYIIIILGWGDVGEIMVTIMMIDDVRNENPTSKNIVFEESRKTCGCIPMSEMCGFSTAGGSIGFTIFCKLSNIKIKYQVKYHSLQDIKS